MSSDESKNITERTIVVLDKKSEVLLAPNIEVTPDPNAEPTSPDPFEDCIRTVTINSMQTIINIRIKNVIIVD